MATWDSTKLQSQLRLTSYKLAQLQERHDQTTNITKRDIATLIERNEMKMAKSKVEKLIQDDRLSILIEILESRCNLLLERFAELRHDLESNPNLTDAAYLLITIGPRTELKEVVILCDMLVQIYGPEATTQALLSHHNSRIPPQVVDAFDRRPPSIEQIDVFMTSIANEFNLSWNPPLLSHQKARALAEILDQNSLSRTIDLQELRGISVRGIPSQPPWLRPRLWKVLLGTLSHQKDFWEVEAHIKRQSYYDLARPLLEHLRSSPSPTSPLSSMDALLFTMAKSLSNLPSEFDVEIESSPLCPFDDSAPEGLKIHDADAVEGRLGLIQAYMHGLPSPIGPPQIRVEHVQTPHIMLSLPKDTLTFSATTSNPLIVIRGHASSLLRLMYIHVSLHSSASATYLTSVLIPLYTVMVQEIDPAELAHVEADTFWLLNELWSEVNELTDTERSQVWVSKFGKRLAWADPNLYEDLSRKGLNPALPNYSYRWLAPLLTRTLAPPALLPIWDALFTQPPRTSSVNAKLEFLLDICTSMLINARPKLFRMGKPPPNTPGLWSDVDATVSSRSTTPIEFEEGFIQGMSFLQKYPVEVLGGSERIIEIAGEIQSRRIMEASSTTRGGLGDKIRGIVWSDLLKRGGPSQSQIPDSPDRSDGSHSPEWPDSGDEGEGDHTERPNALTLSKLGTTVWRGITNQSSMDVPSSPMPLNTPIQQELAATVNSTRPIATEAAKLGGKLGNSIWRGLTNQSAMDGPPSPSVSPPSPVPPQTPISPTSSISSGFWGYTGKFKDSDAAASLSKTGTNITAKASAFWRRSNPSNLATFSDASSHHRTGSVATSSSSPDLLHKRGSRSSSNYDEVYSPPPRPHFRESRYFSPDEHSAGSPSMSFANLPSPPALLTKGRTAFASLAGSTPTPPQRSGPRPLLLNSSSLITSSNPRRSSRSPAPGPRDSVSSTSSMYAPPLQGKNTSYSDRDSDVGTGRLVPLRRTFPPRRPSEKNTEAQSDTGHVSQFKLNAERSQSLSALRKPNGDENASKGWTQVNLPDSQSTLPSSSPPVTPIILKSGLQVQQQPIIPIEEDASPSEGIIGRKKSWNSVTPPGPKAEASDSSTSQDPAPWSRGKRHHGQRPPHLRLKKSNSEFEQSIATQMSDKMDGDPDSLLPKIPGEMLAITPKAADFSSPDLPRTRKNSHSPRRAYNNKSPVRGSGGEEGDDEGYDDFLSAYESEDGMIHASAVSST